MTDTERVSTPESLRLHEQLKVLAGDGDAAAVFAVKLLRDGRLVFASAGEQSAIESGFAAPLMAIASIANAAAGAISSVIQVCQAYYAEPEEAVVGEASITFDGPDGGGDGPALS